MDPYKPHAYLLHKIRCSILEAHEVHARSFPWKNTNDPYLIWLSEIILQQTRTEQGLPYYNKIIRKYPNIHALAGASEEAFLKDWEGLGYYSRARNLLYSARYIRDELGGIFPSTYSDILALKGVGPYTAAAIASFAYNLSFPVVDGNVLRLFSRLFGISDPIDVQTTVHKITTLASDTLSDANPAIFNQTIMDLGATVCTPKSPKCEICLVQAFCVAFKKNLIELLPVKKNRIKKQDLYFNYFFISAPTNRFAMQCRDNSSFWKKMYQFPLIQNHNAFETPEQLRQTILKQWGIEPEAITLLSTGKQTLSHRNIHARLYTLRDVPQNKWLDTWLPVHQRELIRLPLPKLIKRFIEHLLPL